MRRLPILLLLLALAVSCRMNGGLDRQTRTQLEELDTYLARREVFDLRKTEQLNALGKLARSIEDPLRRFDLEYRMAQESFSFSFDSTQASLKRCQSLVADTDRARYNKASIELGHLYGKSGNYMEAHSILYGQIDTAELSSELLVQYYQTLYEFSTDLAGNSGMVERLSIPPAAPYRERLLNLLPQHSEAWRILMRDLFVEQDRLIQADSIARVLLDNTSEQEHAYAIHAYFLSEIANRMGNQAERMKWLVKSAECDMSNAVKDYASLTLVAQIILPDDVDRSFRYLRISQEDALWYNARLRPWQISRFLMDIEDAYSDRQEKSREMINVILGLLAVFTVALSILSRVLVKRSRKLAKARTDLETANASLAAANQSLSELNSQISLADQVKEQYILSFLEGLSGQISLVRSEDNRFRNLLKQGKADELLKELSITGRSEKAKQEFYETFDRTFLAMYPDFVAQFNRLLKEEARMAPPKGRLNTELRIFALIRLGVDDSKKIASMLDYSLSTIYNYKVNVKNAALGNRDALEDAVKRIGK